MFILTTSQLWLLIDLAHAYLSAKRRKTKTWIILFLILFIFFFLWNFSKKSSRLYIQRALGTQTFLFVLKWVLILFRLCNTLFFRTHKTGGNLGNVIWNLKKTNKKNRFITSLLYTRKNITHEPIPAPTNLIVRCSLRKLVASCYDWFELEPGSSYFGLCLDYLFTLFLVTILFSWL